MPAILLVVTALLYFMAAVMLLVDGKEPLALVLFSFFLSNLALAYAAVS